MKPRKITDKLRAELLALKGTQAINSVVYRQYFVFLVSSLETFFRDIFIYIHSVDAELMDKLIEKFKITERLPNSEELTSIEVLSKSFNFQNLNDLESAFDQVWGGRFLYTVISIC